MNWLTVRDGQFLLVSEAQARHDVRREEALAEWGEAAAHGWEAVEQLIDVYRPRGRIENLRRTVDPEISDAQIISAWNQTTGRRMERARAVKAALGLTAAANSILTKIRRWGY